MVNDLTGRMEFSKEELYMHDDGVRAVPVCGVKWCGDSRKYVECKTDDHVMSLVVRASEIRFPTDEEKKKFSWILNPGKGPVSKKGRVLTPEEKDSEYYVDPSTGKKQRGYKFNTVTHGWDYSDVTGDVLRKLLNMYDIRHYDVAKAYGIPLDRFEDRFMTYGRKITRKTLYKLEKIVSNIAGCDINVVKRDLRTIIGKKV